MTREEMFVHLNALKHITDDSSMMWLALDMAIKELGQESRWIPISERLPEEEDFCLCCDKDRYITIGFISKYRKEWCFDDEHLDIYPIAWMPLPEPYEAEKEDK